MNNYLKKVLHTSKAALAKYLGASSGRLQKWESGSLSQQDDLQLLHQLFNLSYAWLVTGEREPLELEAQPSDANTWRLEELEKKNYALKVKLE